MDPDHPNAADLSAIERLHGEDVRASRAGDFRTLRTLMTDDAVILPPHGKPIRGRGQIEAAFGRSEADLGGAEILDYVLDFAEILILGDYAVEWGEIRGSERTTPDSPPTPSSYNLMRVLQKQADGGWKVHRTMWNETS